jgi:hypothetical protein
MATVTKDFKVKNGIKVQGDANIDASLYVAGPNATVNGSDIITEDIITGGTQTNISVTYNPTSKTIDFVAENGIADSTTTDLAEGTNLYFTDERAQDAIGNSLGNGIAYNDTSGSISVDPTLKLGGGGAEGIDGSITLTSQWNQDRVSFNSTGSLNYVTNNLGIKQSDGNMGGYIDTLTSGQHLRLHSAAGNVYLYSNGDGKVYTGDSEIAANVVATVGDIDALTTSDIEEGTNLYFTNQRAIDAIGGSATSANTPNTVVKRDANGSFEAEDITANNVTLNNVIFEDNGGSIGTDSTGLNIFAPNGDVNLAAMTGQVKIGGSQVTTTDNEQTLTNKAIGDSLVFSYGQFDPNGTSIPSTIGVDQNTDLTISSGNNATISSLGDIVLSSAIDGAYIGSTTESNKIATHGYVDNAVSGLSWKESVNLLATTNVDQSAGNAVFPIDGHGLPSEPVYRILLTGQTVATENGIWEYNVVNEIWTRPADSDTVAELIGAAVFVMEGTQYNATSWVQNNHYATTFDQLTWTQFSGSGNYTAGFGINLVGREFSADTTEMATSEALGNAVSDLTDYVDGFLNSNDGTVIGYIDDQDSATLLAANGYSDTLVANGNATATPTYKAIDIDSIAKQVAATVDAPTYGPHTAFSWAAVDYRSAEFLVKVAHSTHTEVSKVLLTLDTSNNIAITEYAIVGTNGSLSGISAGINGSNVELQVSTVQNNSTVTVVGTLLK